MLFHHLFKIKKYQNFGLCDGAWVSSGNNGWLVGFGVGELLGFVEGFILGFCDGWLVKNLDFQ